MTLSNDELDKLADHQKAALLYFEGGKLTQAMDQVERGLELDPDDYKLNAVKGAILLRASARDGKLLDRSLEQLERIYDWRSPMRHEPHLLLNLGLARQKVGLRHSGEAIRLEGQASRAVEKREQIEKLARQERDSADDYLQAADRVLGYLIKRGELLRLAHYHTLQIRYQLGQEKQFEESAEAFFKESSKELSALEGKIQETTSAPHENELMARRAQAMQEEIDVRALYSSWLYQRKRYEEALTQIDRALDLDPKRTNDYYNRGRILLELDRHVAAQSDFRMFLSMSNLPDDNDKVTFAVRVLQK